MRATFALVVGAAFLVACASEVKATKKKAQAADPDDDFFLEDGEPTTETPALEPAYVNEDSGAFGASSRPASKDGGAPKDAGVVVKTTCAGPVAAGDLAIVEILIASRSGSGDNGEWVELKNTRDCWLNVQGITVESPRGSAAANIATVDTFMELSPGGTLVVAGGSDPLTNNGLTGNVIAWSAADVLKNDGDTLTIKLGPTVIDALTYPAFGNLEAGRSLAFPSDCPPNVRSDWTRWSLTFDERNPGQTPILRGTPNRENSDVTCF